MSYAINSVDNILKYADEVLAVSGTVTYAGITADGDGKKIIPAGTVLESASTGTIRTDGDKAMAITDYTGSSAEAVLAADVDVTSGEATAPIILTGTINGAVIPHLSYGSVTALKGFGINLVGAYTQHANPALTFVCTDHATGGKTQIASVAPTLTGGNTYMVSVGDTVTKPVVGADLTGVVGWAAYTLTDPITATNGELVTLCEVSTGDVVVKCGSSVAVVA
jgi:hypothetical protein